MGTVFFQSPTGHMFLGNAYTGTDLFTALRSPPSPAAPTVLIATVLITATRATPAGAERWRPVARG
ncbi:hypothetical protein GCM10009619_20980 [Williamsia maris]|uniref:Uncharacterized protein n=1 Tax=Williamsia maris TaxID=72806 RepID=A0ABT1HDB1_9NOCA|nr:hypothetical protein [Williamsia maris]